MSNRNAGDAEGMGALVAKTIGLFFAWLGTWGLADVQILVGICSGLIFAGYTITQWRALVRRERLARAQEVKDAAKQQAEEKGRP